jgi:phosphoribosylformylglycinamidine cyclo-ligase
MPESPGLSYRAAGVDLDAADRAKEALKALVARTRDRHTLSELGLFGGLYAVPGEYGEPVLVSSADGVGTKLKLAFLSGRHDTVGQDLVNHCVNDILVQGAVPLFFLDYLAAGRLEEGVVTEVVRGVAQACLENRCALLGGKRRRCRTSTPRGSTTWRASSWGWWSGPTSWTVPGSGPGTSSWG